MLFNQYDYEEEYRYFCRCGTPTHIMSITLYKADNDEPSQVAFCFFPERMCEGISLWTRIKRAVKYILGREPEPWNDFILREEDLDEIASIIQRTKEHQCTT